MDISFSIPGAGPLSQISAHIISYDTAVWLASGAIGWWKARERSLSLTETLSARKTSLVSTSSFNYAEYREIRKFGAVLGLAVQGGALCQLTAGVESTAVTENPGIDCLRALTTGLLCFYSVQVTSAILADIIPYGLLQSEQDDNDFEFNGPVFASLSDWVKAVAEEEDCNNFRQRILQKASQHCQDLTGTHAVQPNDDHGYDELGLLLGCLRWMVTPRHRRDLLKYPTRSIRVWTTMAAMSQLGFSVSVSLNAIHSKEQYDATLEPPYEDNFPDVVLVTSATGKTDSWIVLADNYEHLKLRPQIIPLLSIPYAAFGRLHKQYGLVDAAELIDIWKVSFRYAKSGVMTPALSHGSKVLLKPSRSDYNVYRESHKALIGLWSPYLARIMRPAFDDYLPKTLIGDWAPEAFMAFFDRQRNGERIYLEDVEILRNVYRLTAIIFGTIYGACSIALSTQVSDDRMDQPGDEALEVAFSPDIILSEKIFAWASTLGSALSGLLEYSGWVGLLLELVTGIEHPEPLDEQPTAGLPHEDSNIANQDVFDKAHGHISNVMGVQANGVFAVSEFILRPSTNVASSLTFHVGVGRILDIPVDQVGYVRSFRGKVSSIELTLDPEPEFDRLSLGQVPDSSSILRIDAEPHWLNDPQKICFAVRSSGALVAMLNITTVLEKLLYCTFECDCSSPLHEVSVPRSERWQNVTVRQLLQSGLPGVPKSSISFSDQDRILINMGGDDACRVYTAGILYCRKLAICRDCISCARKRIRDRNNNLTTGNAALIIG